jgi:hypothetical protein
MTVGLETWVSIGTLLGVAVGLFVAIRTTGADLRTELKGGIAELRTELKGDIAELRTELKGDIAELRTELKGDIAKLDDRVYALAAGLRPQLDEERAKEAPSAR